MIHSGMWALREDALNTRRCPDDFCTDAEEEEIEPDHFIEPHDVDVGISWRNT